MFTPEHARRCRETPGCEDDLHTLQDRQLFEESPPGFADLEFLDPVSVGLGVGLRNSIKAVCENGVVGTTTCKNRAQLATLALMLLQIPPMSLNPRLSPSLDHGREDQRSRQLEDPRTMTSSRHQ
jgi:hypothetical protein